MPIYNTIFQSRQKSRLSSSVGPVMPIYITIFQSRQKSRLSSSAGPVMPIYITTFQAGQKPHTQSTLILKTPVLSPKAAVRHRSSRLRKSQRPKLVTSEVACRAEGMPAADVLLPCHPTRLTGLKAPTN